MNLSKTLSFAALVFVAGVSLFALYSLQYLRFDYDFEHFLPEGDPDTEFFLEFREKFESDNDFVLVGLRNEEGIFHQDFLKSVNELALQLEELPHVDTVISPTRLMEVRKNYEIPYLRIDEPENLSKDSARIYRSPELVGSFFSQDAKSILIHIKTTQFLSKEGCDILATSLQNFMEASTFKEYHLAGRCIGEVYYINLMRSELGIFLVASLVLIVIFLSITFRSIWAVWLPIVVVGLSIIWILSLMTILGRPMNFVQTMLPSIMFVVGMSDVVHIVSKYMEELRLGKTKTQAVRIAFKEIGLATFFTSLTTSVGFFTLLFSTVVPVKDFGVFTAVGVFFAYILAYTLLPAAMVLLPPPRVVKKRYHASWTKILSGVFLFSLRRRRLILWVSGALVVLSAVGISKVVVNNYLLEGLRSDNPLRQEFNYFEDNFSGVRPFEMAVMVKDTSQSVYDEDVLNEMAKLQDYLTQDYGAGSVGSVVTVVRMANRALKGGGEEHYVIPEKPSDLDKIVSRLRHSTEMNVLVDETETMARFTGSRKDVGWIEIKKANDSLDEFFRNEIDSTLIHYKLTGTATLIDNNNNYLSLTMIQSLSIAFIVVALIVGLLMRSVRMVLIAFVPNVIPLLMIAGIMGFTGMELKVTNTLIFTIAFGIAVDDTIHFISRLRLELNNGSSTIYAIKRTMLSTGKAIVLTSIILSAGFLTLLYSDFLGTYQTGLLIGLTLLFAVAADLLLLPVLVLMFFRKRKD